MIAFPRSEGTAQAEILPSMGYWQFDEGVGIERIVAPYLFRLTANAAQNGAVPGRSEEVVIVEDRAIVFVEELMRTLCGLPPAIK